MSFSMVPGMTLQRMQRVMSGKPAAAPEPAVKPEPAPQSKRARQRGGQFKPDDLATPDVNEAWRSEN